MNKEIYEEYKRKRQELRVLESMSAQRGAELRRMARDFGLIAEKLIRLYTPEEKDQNTKVKLGNTACCEALYCRLRADKLENQLDFLRYSLRLDTHYKIMDARWEVGDDDGQD